MTLGLFLLVIYHTIFPRAPREAPEAEAEKERPSLAVAPPELRTNPPVPSTPPISPLKARIRTVSSASTSSRASATTVQKSFHPRGGRVAPPSLSTSGSGIQFDAGAPSPGSSRPSSRRPSSSTASISPPALSPSLYSHSTLDDASFEEARTPTQSIHSQSTPSPTGSKKARSFSGLFGKKDKAEGTVSDRLKRSLSITGK